ncbi:MAG: hypothetical protein RIK87_23415 [Fuerstiella sp.]
MELILKVPMPGAVSEVTSGSSTKYDFHMVRICREFEIHMTPRQEFDSIPDAEGAHDGLNSAIE